MPIDRRQLGLNIAAARKRARLTQEDVASALRIPRPTYAAYEIGKTEITATRLSELGHIIGCTSAVLLGEATLAAAQIDDFVDDYLKLDVAVQSIIRRQARVIMEANLAPLSLSAKFSPKSK
jgi:transcriptional regulator with XRE-family HTH domain